jgi:hypothetical protein
MQLGLKNRFSGKQSILILIGCAAYITLLLRFKSSGGDWGDFFSAGGKIWLGSNPYGDSIYVNSPVSAFFLSSIERILPVINTPTFVQILNIIGLSFFLWVITQDKNPQAWLIVMSILPFLNVTRALFANSQVTGLVCGFIGLTAYLLKSAKFAALSPFPAWLAFELKPQMVAPIILVSIVSPQIKKLYLAHLIGLIISGHVLLNLFYGKNLDSIWIQKIFQYSGNSLKEGYEISVWKLIALGTGETQLTRIGSILVAFLFLLLILHTAFMHGIKFAILGLALFPTALSYLHLYDFIPLVMIIIFVLLKKNSGTIWLPILVLTQSFPYEGMLSWTIFSILGLTLWLLISQGPVAPLQVVFSALYLSITFVLKSQTMGISEELQLIIFFTIPLTLYAFTKFRFLKANFASATLDK